MATPSASLGISTGFNATQFRNGIRFAMQMGAPPEPDRQAKFIFKSTGRSYLKDGVAVVGPRLDRDGVPLDPDVQVVETTARTVLADCAIEISAAEQEELPVGKFRPTKAEVTLLDVDYVNVNGCRELQYTGDRYLFGYESQSLGMFGVGIHVLTFYALDES